MYLAACIALFAMQRSLIYYPQRTLPPHDDSTLAIAVDGARVLVSTRASSGPNAVIYFGGNGETVFESLPPLQRAFPETALFALHYRGYNGSTGTPTEASLIADAQILFDQVHQDHAHITLIGRSLGSGVAIHLASLRPVARLVLVTPYDSLQDLAARRFPFFPIRWLLLDKFESWRYAPKISAPTLLLAAQNDEVIPRASTELLYRHLPKGLATLIVVPDAAHNTISDTTEYTALLRGPP
ncbi:MAG TPA: alpha/beta fold hydrolase [Steroidobacteraceae bacterium]|nr:alpha/beta fold hydrolase [Steroidobacteraceae bacterium]